MKSARSAHSGDPKLSPSVGLNSSFMIVISRNYGRLGNRLILNAHLLAAACEYGVGIANPAFAEYAQYFESTANDVWCRHPSQADEGATPPPSSLRRKLAYQSVYLGTKVLGHLRMTRYPFHVLRLGSGENCDLASDSFRELATSGRTLFVSGWLFRSKPILDKHAETVREHFRILPQHQSNVNQVVDAMRQDADVLVGVHIRHGDYKTWQNGVYYYTIDQYTDAMRRVRDQLSGKRVRFMVCGNTNLSSGDFGDLNVTLGPDHLIEDMYAFAQMDYLVGPPSTYTTWAAFYGNVPLQFMQTADQAFDLSSIDATAKAA